MVRLDELFRDREQLHFRLLSKSLTDANGDFDNENLSTQYAKFEYLRQSLLSVQKSLSALEIVEWHQITSKFHPAASVLKHIREVSSGEF